MKDKKTKILIMDDEKDICRFAGSLFKKEGFLTYSALSHRQAIKIAKKVQPQIALLDIYLKRGKSGLDTLRELKKAVPLCKCIMITWDRSKKTIKEAKIKGASCYLAKPLTVEQLIKTVKSIIKNIRRRI